VAITISPAEAGSPTIIPEREGYAALSKARAQCTSTADYRSAAQQPFG
jgi:hypothetical protein